MCKSVVGDIKSVDFTLQMVTFNLIDCVFVHLFFRLLGVDGLEIEMGSSKAWRILVLQSLVGLFKVKLTGSHGSRQSSCVSIT